MPNRNPISAEQTLQQELKQLAILGAGLLLLLFGLLLSLTDNTSASLWLLQAGLCWVLVILMGWHKLPLNRADAASALYPNLGWGNRLTIARGWLVAACCGFLWANDNLLSLSWLAALWYSIAAVLDRIDGYVARRSQQVSLLGNELDINFDALGLVIAPLLAWNLGKIHVSYLLLSVAYYLYRWALQQRAQRDWVIYPVPANPLRRSLAGFQMGFIAVALWPLLNPQLTVIASVAFMLPVLFGFGVDWGMVCGWLKPQAIPQLTRVSFAYLQPGLRLLVLWLACQLYWPVDQLLTASNLALLLSLVLLTLGFAGRLGAALLLVSLGWQNGLNLNNVSNFMLIVSTSWLLMLGTGRYSLWQWGDDWVSRYDGA